MSSNSFGSIFRITTWGESHGKAIGVVIDGCPAGLALSLEDIQVELNKRASSPANSYTTPRKESDVADILSGTFEGKTTGAPISIMIQNKEADSSQYDSIKNILRPGHANFTYLEKYGCFDYRGGGRASARETASRVAAGAVAKKLLSHYEIELAAYISRIGSVALEKPFETVESIIQARDQSFVYCPCEKKSKEMMVAIDRAKEQGDSLGGIVHFLVVNLPIGLGDPVYEKLEANLAKAMLSIPATKAFAIGEGFEASSMSGSAHNDHFIQSNGKTILKTNHAGGTLGGISTGAPLIGSVAFKPTSSIKQAQPSVDLQGQSATFQLSEKARHDPCVAIRAVPVVEAMLALTLADAFLLNRLAKL